MPNSPELKWGPKKLRVWVNEVLIPWCQSGRPLRSLTCEIDERPAGTIILPQAQRGGSGGGSASTFPYQVRSAAPDSTRSMSQATPRMIVEIESWLMKEIPMDGKQTVTGLGAPFPVVPGTGSTFFVWIEATIAAGAVTGVEIKHGDAPWDEYPEPVKWDPSDSDPDKQQVKAYQLIAYLVPEDADYASRIAFAIGEDTVQIVQCVTTHLLLCEKCVDSFDILVFAPWHAPGPDYTPPE